jgi:hypothetical protein
MKLRLRKQFPIARLMTVTPLMGISLAVFPWPVCVVVAALIVVPFFVSGPNLFQWLLFYALAGFLVGLMTPPVVTHSPRTPVGPVQQTTPAAPISEPPGL